VRAILPKLWTFRDQCKIIADKEESDEEIHADVRRRHPVDDVEFHLDEATQTAHFRSASRIGYSDLGVNRKRMEEFTSLYRALP